MSKGGFSPKYGEPDEFLQKGERGVLPAPQIKSNGGVLMNNAKETYKLSRNLPTALEAKSLHLFKIPLLVLFPGLVAIHGFYWVHNSESLAAAVYGLKVIFLPFLLFVLYKYRVEVLRNRITKTTLLISGPAILISIITPLALGEELSFYYISDLVGISITILSVPAFYILLVRRVLTFTHVEKIYSAYLAIISVYIIAYYYITGGVKISITPEMHIPMAIVLGAYLTPREGGYKPNTLLIALIAAACVYSLLRENLVLYLLIGLVCIVRGVMYQKAWRAAIKFILVTGMVGLLTGGVAEERMHTIKFERGAEAVIEATDKSINQRFVEIRLMLHELEIRPITLITGMGFGATYKNLDGVLQYYGEQVHNAHSTPFLVLFRNGVYGLLVFLLPLFLACFGIFNKSINIYRSSLVVGTLYLALLFNQYLYWNIQYGLAVGLMLYFFKGVDVEVEKAS